jgi:hypothetical protein
MTIAARSLLLGLAAGTLAGLAAGAAFEPDATFGWWGAVDGFVVGVLVFLLALNRRSAATAGVVRRWLLAAVLAALLYLTLWWNIAWQVPLGSLEGLWLWLLAGALLGGLVLAVRAAWSSGRSARSELGDHDR